jgi:xanthine dehydrogenase YagS FAD-binding subunit
MTTLYRQADSVESALSQLGVAGARALGGGTDLLGAMEAGLDPALYLVDLTRASALTGVAPTSDGGVRIGAATRLDAIASDPLIASRYATLSLALGAVGTPALRAMGTLGGNLAQRPRCWYLRSKFPCHKNGGSGCPAAQGENQYHSIIGGGPCHAAHPSDPAVALLALDATVVVRSAKAIRRPSIDALYAAAASRPDSEISLEHGEIIEGVELSSAAASGTQLFTKLMQRGAWDFATVSLAGVKRTDGSVRLALGGVAPLPWLVNPSVGEDVASGELDEDSADALALRALHDARPMANNGYKLSQAVTLLKRAMLELSRA